MQNHMNMHTHRGMDMHTTDRLVDLREKHEVGHQAAGQRHADCGAGMGVVYVCMGTAKGRKVVGISIWGWSQSVSSVSGSYHVIQQ